MVTMEGVASAVRELYLDRFQPQKRRGRRLHALSPNVLIRRLDPAVTAQYQNALNEPMSEEEDWLAAEEPDVISENDVDNGPSTSAPDNSKRGGRKRKQSGGDRAGKRKRNTKMVGNLQIKEEQPDPDEVSSPTLPMTFLPTTNYSQDPLASTPSDTMALRATRNPRIKQEPVENIIVMPFNTEEEAAAAQGGRSKKSLKDLTQYLLELNNKNLQCEDRMKKFREEFEQRMINVETEKKQNEMEIDKVLGQIQGWKDRLVSGDRSTPPDRVPLTESEKQNAIYELQLQFPVGPKAIRRARRGRGRGGPPRTTPRNDAEDAKRRRAEETLEEREVRLAKERERKDKLRQAIPGYDANVARRKRAKETPEQKEARLAKDRERKAKQRQNATADQLEAWKNKEKVYKANAKKVETPEKAVIRKAKGKESVTKSRKGKDTSLLQDLRNMRKPGKDSAVQNLLQRICLHATESMKGMDGEAPGESTEDPSTSTVNPFPINLGPSELLGPGAGTFLSHSLFN